jgi:hypothetical protein
LSEASKNGIVVVCGGVLDLPEKIAGEREVAGGRDSEEFEKLGAGRVKLEFSGGYEMSLKLFHVNERIAFL